MDQDRKQDVEIFMEAIQLHPEDRASFLEAACGENIDLRRRVESLVKSNDRIGGFLEEPIIQSAIEVRAQFTAAEKVGDQIGRYRLLLQIGEGGCGIVFLAEQREPVHRRVALKIIKPGMDTKSVIARFEAERQALALMDHPNIAKIFDAGSTESGRPYFVMELVRGVKITEYCDANSLTTRERLELFKQVCEAVQHAHQKGIIHRDIKPSNILVTVTATGAPVPVVIDFGIAKATTNQPLTDKTLFTSFEMLIGTPAYMSPEQVAFSSMDLDTRTDIYSLGVLLYEILTGSTPFDTQELLKAGLDEIRRVVREQEPVRPSTRLSKLTPSDLTIVAQARHAEPSTLVRAMRGDLDWIVMKALEKDRTRRFATAHGLALDIQRFLADEVVSARSPSAIYKFQKMARRNKLVFGGLAIIATLVIAGLVIVSLALAREKKARLAAVTEAARSRTTSEFLNDMILSIDPAVARGRDATAVFREMLDNATDRAGRQFGNQPVALADLRATLGEAYGSLGQFDKEESMVKAALEAYGVWHAAPEKIAAAHAALSEMYGRQANSMKSEEEARQTLLLVNNPQSRDAMRARLQLARAILKEGRPAEAEAMLRSMLEVNRHGEEVGPDQLFMINLMLAAAVGTQGQLTNAETVARVALSIAQTEFGSNSLQMVDAMGYVSGYLAMQGKWSEAEVFSRQCVAIARKIVPPDHPELEQSLWALGGELQAGGKNEEAAQAYRELLAVRRKRYGNQDDRVMETASTLVRLLTPELNEQKVSNIATDLPEAWAVLADDQARRGRWPEARAAAAKFLEARPGDPNAYHLLAPLLAQSGDLAAYGALCAEISRLFAGATDPHVADRMAKDCLILARKEADLRTPAALAEAAVIHGLGDPGSLPYFQFCKALAEYRQNRWASATEWAQRAATNSNLYASAESQAVLAMAQCQAGHNKAARSALRKCQEIVAAKMGKPGSGDLGQDWRDWIIVHALLAEAGDMIGAGDEANRPSKN